MPLVCSANIKAVWIKFGVYAFVSACSELMYGINTVIFLTIIPTVMLMTYLNTFKVDSKALCWNLGLIHLLIC